MTPTTAHVNSWDRAAIVALGGAGCALSYDALQQMATAIHIRGFLTFVFPLVIDGFIAYGVRALLVLRTAPLAARCYVWLLFATATAASIWANALHAVRLNEQRPERTGLRLGDITVGVLSTLAPLALAGAVHLYILIARRVTEAAVTGTLDNQSAWSGRDGTVAPDIVPIATDHVSADNVRRPTVRTPATEVSVETNTVTALIEASEHSPVGPEAERPDGAADLDGQSVTKPPPVTILPPAKAQETFADTIRARRPDNRDQKPTAVTDDELLDIARTAVTDSGRVTRKVVGDAIRSRNHGLGNDRLTDLMRLLREERDKAQQ
ncbi:DUF2637 domain-containing protein [Streptomyces sp. NBC_00401]|uniref:DUF2637 domain-containing protein n=1 Tax=Streptomyces sp. NBC_00401 TaxID=2975738 RepID=UPI0022503DF3|nr:DUF2637 domain-containing protein [Streptomyces sp. NBC_00401]MCX5085671.1 DUF2637 domain-containing protein [Streptomyces sp. NBC_00401]